MKHQQLLNKIEGLVAKFTDPAFEGDNDQLKSWRSTVQRAMIQDDLKKHEGVQLIIEQLTKDLGEMDLILKTMKSDKLSEAQRDRIIDRKELYLWFIGLFIDINTELKDIEAKVDEQANYYEDNKSNYII